MSEKKREKKSHKELRNAAKTYDFYHNENNNEVEVWVKLLENYIEDDLYGPDVDVFKFEVNTDKMIEYEAPFFRDNKYDDYSPVLYTFTAVIPKNDDQPNILKKFKKAKGKYIRCLLQRIDRVTSPDHLKGHVTIGAQLTYDDTSNNILCRVSQAALTIVASENISLTANQSLETLTTTNGIASESQFTSNPELPDSFDANGDGSPKKNTNIRIYKVGKANTVLIRHHCGDDIFFDCGYEDTIDAKTGIEIYKNSADKISLIHPTLVILSHFHEDHVNLLPSIKKDKLKAIIFNGGQSSCTNKQVLKLLTKFHNICIDLSLPKYAKKDVNALIQSKFDGITIYKTSYQKPSNDTYGIIPTSHQANTIINNNGLMMLVGSLKIPYNRMILPGDVSYFCWPRGINELALDRNLTKLLVPHHGGEVYTYKSYNNTAKYKSIYVSRDGSYVPITNNINPPYVKNEHRKYLEDGMHVYASKFLYTEHISNASKPYYSIQITPDSPI